jgi:hypothetical protein
MSIGSPSSISANLDQTERRDLIDGLNALAEPSEGR